MSSNSLTPWINRAPIHQIIPDKLFRDTLEEIEKGQYGEAIDELIAWITDVKNDDLKNVYTCLFKLLPKCREIELNRIQPYFELLLKKSSHLVTEQRTFASCLAGCYALRLNNSLDPWDSLRQAMAFYARALQIVAFEYQQTESESLKEEQARLHAEASSLFVPIIKEELIAKQEFSRAVERALLNSELLERSVSQIETLKSFCVESQHYKEVVEELCKILRPKIIDKLTPGIRSRYDAVLQRVNMGLKSGFAPSGPLATERYRKYLEEFRAHFRTIPALGEVEKAYRFQEDNFKAFQELFNKFLVETFAMIGFPPCAYDMRVMGSAARQELTPKSDLDLLILIENREHIPYFQRVAKFLQLQILSLGETDAIAEVFTCLPDKYPKGFYLDATAEKPQFIQDPLTLAKMQSQVEDSDIKYVVLQTVSLARTSSTLEKAYSEALAQNLSKEMRQRLAKENLDEKVRILSITKCGKNLLHLRRAF